VHVVALWGRQGWGYVAGERGRNIGVLMTFCFPTTTRRSKMLRSVLLWLIGIPIPIIILLWLFLD